MLGKDELIIEYRELILLDHVQEGKVIMRDDFFIGKFKFLLASSSKALYRCI